MSVNSKMTAIADEIRTLSGTTGTMGLDAMATHISDANNELTTQGSLIAQIQAAVDSLPEAGGGGSGGVETVSVEIVTEDLSEISAVFTTYENGAYNPEIFHVEPAVGGGDTFSNVVVGSYIYITLGQCNESMPIRLDGSLRVVEELTFYYEPTRIIVIEVNGSGSIYFYYEDDLPIII